MEDVVAEHRTREVSSGAQCDHHLAQLHVHYRNKNITDLERHHAQLKKIGWQYFDAWF